MKSELRFSEIKDLLDHQHNRFNHPDFIENDPISIPHLFSKKEDIEIAGFLTATISWGNRKAILTNAKSMMQRMDNDPYHFVLNHTKKDLSNLNGFVHRTFNARDFEFFIKSLKNLYLKHQGLEGAFAVLNETGLADRIHHFRNLFLKINHPNRLEKHISDPLKNSSAKRICMYLRWMVRNDMRKVDFGIWKTIKPAELCLPLDIHTGNISRRLGILARTQNDWKSVTELTTFLRKCDANDPVKYDFALFGMGIEKLL
ncbi:MAG: TIGR02757 family protein [Sphingobacteriaceae bacterium]|nr:TIGR02757 family protein [Sphingobacteriaceae bacterium]